MIFLRLTGFSLTVGIERFWVLVKDTGSLIFFLADFTMRYIPRLNSIANILQSIIILFSMVCQFECKLLDLEIFTIAHDQISDFDGYIVFI